MGLISQRPTTTLDGSVWSRELTDGWVEWQANESVSTDAGLEERQGCSSFRPCPGEKVRCMVKKCEYGLWSFVCGNANLHTF